MKINKHYLLGLAVAVLGGFSSCNTDVEGTIYDANFEQVSFESASANISVNVNESSTTIPVTITRGLTANASTVTFTAEASEEGIFSNDANGTVTFEAGQNSATFHVTASNLEKEVPYTYTLTLSEAAISTADPVIAGAKQNTVFTIKVTREGDWTAWEPLNWNYPSGISTFDEWKEAYAKAEDYDEIAEGGESKLPTYTYEQYLTGTYAQPVFMRSSLLNPNNAQLMLYDWFYGVDLVINWDKEENVFSVDEQWTGYVNSNYGDVYVQTTYTYAGETPDKYPCKYDEEKGLFTLDLVYYVDAGIFGYGPEYIQLPGFKQYDYSIEPSYVGHLIDASGSEFILANIMLGKDVEYVKYAFVPASDRTATIEGLANGTIEGEKLTESGTVNIPVAESGTYYLVVVAFAGDEAVGEIAYKIDFTSVNDTADTWSPVGTGYYTYTAFFTDENEEPITDGPLVIYQNDKHPEQFKIADWGYGVDFFFTWDGKDGNGVTVPVSLTGVVHPQYGDIYVSDFPTWSEGYYSYDDYPCSYDAETQTFSFPVVYWDLDDPTYPWGYDEETFKVTWGATPATVSARNVKAKSTVIQKRQQRTKKYSRFGNNKKQKKAKKVNRSLSLSVKAFK